MDCFAALAMTKPFQRRPCLIRGHTSAFPRRDAPEVLQETFAPPNRGRRESRVSDAPAAARGVVVNTRVSHHEFTGNIRLSPRNGFNDRFVLSPVTGLFCPRRLADTSARLDTSVGVSEPHDFAVRSHHHSSREAAASTASRSAFVTIASRPSVWNGMALNVPLIWG